MSFTCPDCKTKMEGMNCAHTLCRAMGWKNKPGCVSLCKCKYPVRAKEVRDKIFKVEYSFLDNNTSATSNAFIYCETSGGQGHVYYGTYTSCVKGNGLSASGMSSCSIFDRYG